MIAHLDCSTGVSGDKFLGALLDAGMRSGAFTPGHLQAIAAALAPEARVHFARGRSAGVAGMGVSVEAAAEPPARSWAAVRSLIAGSSLAPGVQERALAVFERLAQAEAEAHGCDIEDVHFHEVGAIDSIVDIVGVCAGLEALAVERLVVSTVATGYGTVQTAHGVLPVPAPATARLLVGVPTVAGDIESELTTPTGAALVAVLASEFGPMPAATATAVGFGLGTRDIGRPNVCKLTLADEDLAADRAAPAIDVLATETVSVLETNVDHISGEAVAFAVEQLLAEGASDAWLSPILMKKGRPAYLLSALVATSACEHTAERMIALTGTLGVRRTDVIRFVAPRKEVDIETPYGVVRYKVGAGQSRPEADDVARIAREMQVSFRAAASALEQFAPRT